MGQETKVQDCLYLSDNSIIWSDVDKSKSHFYKSERCYRISQFGKLSWQFSGVIDVCEREDEAMAYQGCSKSSKLKQLLKKKWKIDYKNGATLSGKFSSKPVCRWNGVTVVLDWLITLIIIWQQLQLCPIK